MKPLKIKINLLPKEEIEEKALENFLKWSLTAGRYIIVGTEIIVLLAFFSRFKFDRELSDLHEEISQKEAIVRFNQDFEGKVRSIQKTLSEIKNLEKESDFPSRLLNFLKENIPQDVTLESLSFSQEKISLVGASSSTSAFIDFLTSIRTSPKFSNLVLEDLSQREEGRLRFNFTASVNKENFY